MATFFSDIFGNLMNIDLKMVIMWLIGGTLIYLAIAKEMEPSLLMPLGFGAILVNLPQSGVLDQIVSVTEAGEPVIERGAFEVLFGAGIANELFPLLLFIGIGAMIDFGPLLTNPKLMLFGAAAQFGIFFTLSMSSLFGFSIEDAASIGIIGAADGPSSIFVSQYLHSTYQGAIMVAAYSYMALVPIIQPPVIKLITTKEERLIRMNYEPHSVSQKTKILFPIIITVVVGLVAPKSLSLIGFLMFGNLIRECGVLNSISASAQNELANLVTIVLGISISTKMKADEFLKPETLLIMLLGLVAFIFDTVGGVMFAKIINLFLPKDKKLNPMIGATGISAFPMSARVVHKMGLEEDPQNFLLMQTIGVNVSGQIASVIAAGVLLNLVG